jgi:hypothetical protein
MTTPSAQHFFGKHIINKSTIAHAMTAAIAKT